MSNTTSPGRPSSTYTGMRAVTPPRVDVSTDAHNWMDAATCRRYVHRRSTNEGIDWFDLDHRTAEKICGRCPVRAACAERVLKLMQSPVTHPKAGVWAGKPFGKDAKEQAA